VRASLLAIALCLLAPVARAHEGPPFPIAEERPVGPYQLALWADPDIGTGQVYVLLQPGEGQRMVAPRRVRIGVQPASRRAPERVYELASQPVRSGARFFGEVQLDRGELFRFRAIVEGPAGGGETSAEVEATPDGVPGPLGALVYLAPFVAVGFVWVRAALRRRNVGRSKPASPP
jgi:hypothetical protein